MNNKKIYTSALILGAALVSNNVFAVCPAPLPTHDALVSALKAAKTASATDGFALNMWVTLVTRGGVVCDVAYTGAGPGQQWPGSRVISAQKANTANAFSLPVVSGGLALSTANLYSATQPGGSLFGLQESNPVNVTAAYAGVFNTFGTATDPMIGYRIGGVNVFGGGLALYDSTGALQGAIGVSGDSSCADHNIAWRTRHTLNLDHVPKGVGAKGDDNIVYDISNGDTTDIANIPGLGKSTSGWGHPACGPVNNTAISAAQGFAKAGTTAPTAAP